jgi:hypothetical protein
VRNWISKGLIPAVRIGKKWMVEEARLKNSVITDNEIQKIVCEIINKSIGFKK